MPATYAHFKMGALVRRELDGSCEAIEGYPSLFNIGLHGPDILFFYRAWFPNKVNKQGHDIHNACGRNFFERALEVVSSHSGDMAYEAYLYGVMCHFALDVSCHGYVTEKMTSSNISHTAIETSFDGSLMASDGYDPLKYKPTAHLVGTKFIGSVIKDFYDDLTSSMAAKSVNHMKFISDFLITSSPVKRALLFNGAALIGKSVGIRGLVPPLTPDPNCQDSNAELTRRLHDSVKVAVGMISEPSLNHDIYNYTFSSKL